MDEIKIVNKLLEHDERFEVLERKIDQSHQELLQGQDEMMAILRRLDQERVFTTEWIKRIEGEVEKHQGEIIKIKQVLKIS